MTICVHLRAWCQDILLSLEKRWEASGLGDGVTSTNGDAVVPGLTVGNRGGFTGKRPLIKLEKVPGTVQATH
jgi:hypothetical protein